MRLTTEFSELTMVPSPCASAIVALTDPLRFKKKVSLASFTKSPLTCTVTVLLVCPGEKISVVNASAV